MTTVARSGVGGRPTSGELAWPSLIETALTLVAIAVILPLFQRLAVDDHGRGGRFAAIAISVSGVPDRVLPALCNGYGARAEPAVRDRLCRSGAGSSGRTDAMPAVLVGAFAQAARAFRRPLAAAEQRRGELRLQQREGLGDLLALDQAIDAIDAELQPYIDRYALVRDRGGPLPLACAFAMVNAALAGPPERGEVADANALLLLGGALDGQSATQPLSAAALLPAARAASEPGCADMTLPEALSSSAALMAEARQARVIVAKNEAMRGLLHTAGWQWAAWMLFGLVLVKASRWRNVALLGAGLALAIWALAAWIGRVPWPFGGDRAFEAASFASGLLAPPPGFVLGLLATAAIALVAAVALPKRLPSPPQALASRIGYPGLVAATGVGWLVLLDLSANGSFGNRYLALYHQGHLWLGMLILTVVAFLRPSLGRALAWTLSRFDAATAALRRRAGAMAMTVAAIALALVLVGGVGAALSSVPQITSELGRLWLIVGASWFFFLRGDPLLARLARSGGSLASLLRYVGPLLFVVLVLVGIQVVTRDMGPLLIACYAAGAFVAAAIAMWWHERRGAYRGAFILTTVVFVAWIVAVTFALFELGPLNDVTAARLENLAAPLASANDQLALVTWFQRAAPPDGFGVGAVPWCGHASALGCPGVPAQIQSDYTLTALVGEFGWSIAWTITLGAAIWLHRLIRHHGRATRGEPRLVAASGRMVSDDQALLSWLGVTWVVLTLCQLAVTVAGNLAVLPLTGVTFPFVSFGMTSLLANLAMLGLVINVSLPERALHG
ncbi:MAG TPA: FtsW/RodA/SpoVE family cell cycle protein [Casimicrobiaceae bacterium]|nr:FtsW/RodA/SpoVE family cell cycle protein [Casimicrobiaceae bacterium]